MGTIVLAVILFLLIIGGSGYYARGRFGHAGLGGVFGVVLVVLVLVWLFDGIGYLQRF
jgi:hypothetical protein